MRILLVEDNTFNAFCLTRLLKMVYQQIEVTVAGNSFVASSFFAQQSFDLIILDGDLGDEEGTCSGPVLADTFWLAQPQLPIIVWTDSESLRQSFSDVFRQYNKPFDENTCWAKLISQDHIRQALAPVVDRA